MKLFTFGPEMYSEIELALSAERLSSYMTIDGSLESAVQLYCWNAAVSSAFFGPIGVLEITLRNALHRELCIVFSDAWFSEPSFLQIDSNFERKIAQAERDIKRFGKVVTAPRVIAELSFGFWVNLLRPKYVSSLWGPALSKAFPPRTKRATVEGYLEPLLRFRNRVAHHEPIYKQNLEEQYKRLLAVIALVRPALVTWVEYHSRVPESIVRPAATARILF